MLDSFDEERMTLTKAIDEDYLPFLMRYHNELVKTGDISKTTEARVEHNNDLLKGFYMGHDTYLHSMNKFTWASNSYMKQIYNKNKDCTKVLDKNGGECYCDKHSWLRGQVFTKGGTRMIAHWESNECNILSGVFASKCELVFNKGTNKPTMCPINKYWTGIKRGGNNGLD